MMMQCASIARLALTCCFACGAFVGCNRSSEVPVSGTVTYDGAPIEVGSISFVPSDPKARSHGAAIAHGAFQTKATPGVKQVKITASRPVPFNPKDPDTAHMREDFLPERFNQSSTLTAEISTDRENVLKFDLTSK